jgi:Mg-chelatase subunit ChlD
MRGGAYYDKHGIPIKRRGDKALYIFAVSATQIFGPGKELQSSTAECNHRNLQKVDASSKAKDLATSSTLERSSGMHACMRIQIQASLMKGRQAGQRGKQGGKSRSIMDRVHARKSSVQCSDCSLPPTA